MRIILLGFVLLFATLVAVPLASALNFSTHPNSKSNSLTAIFATGEVETGDTEKLKALLDALPLRKNTAIYLASGGGSLGEGVKLGSFFRKARIKTVIEDGYICASACALAFLGGTDSEGKPWRSSSSNSKLGFHAFRPLLGQQPSSDDVQEIVAFILAYGRYVDAPIELIIANFATPSDQMYWVTNAEICALGIKLWSVEKNSFICNR